MKNHKGQKDHPASNHPWIRRLGRVSAIMLAILILLRIALWLSLPWLLTQSAQRVGLQCDYEQLHLSLITGDMEVWHLQLAPIDSNDQLVDMEYCRAKVSIRSLFSKYLIVDRVEVDGIDVTVTRKSDGTFNGLEDLFAILQAQQVPVNRARPESETSTAFSDIVLTPPFRLRALRLQHVLVHYVDLSVTPQVDTMLDATFRLSDVGFSRRETRFQLTMASEPILNQLVIEGTVESAPDSLMAKFLCNMRGLHAMPLAGYLGPQGLSSASQTLEAGLQGELALTTHMPSPPDSNAISPSQGPHLDAHVTVNQAFVKADNRTVLGLKTFSLTANIPDHRTLNIKEVLCAQGDMHVWLREPDAIEVAGLRIQPAPGHAKSVRSPKPRVAPLAWSLKQLNLEAMSLHVHDTLANPAIDSSVTLDRLTIGNLRRDVSGNYDQANVEAQLSAPGIFRSAQLEGKADLISLDKNLDVSFRVEGFAPTGLGAYLSRLGLESHHKDTRFSGHLQADLAGPRDDGSMRVDARITDVLVQDPNELFGLDRIAIDQLEINPLTQQLHVTAIEVSGQRVPVKRNADETYSVLGFTLRPGTGAKTGVGVQAQPEVTDPNLTPVQVAIPGSMTIDRFTWRNNQITLIDQAMPAGEVMIIPITYGLDINDLQWIPSDANAPPRAAQVSFWCQAPGVAESLRLSGTVTPAPPGIRFDLNLAGTGLNGQRLAPYLESFGMEPLFVQAQVKALVKGQIIPQTQGLKTSVAISDVLFSEPNQIWVQVQAINVEEMVVQGPDVTIGDLQIHDPKLSLTRDAHGALVTAGFRMLPQKTHDQTLTFKPVTIPVQLEQFTVSGGKLLWQDHGVQPPVDLSLLYEASLSKVAFNGAGVPAQLTVQLSIPSVLHSMQISGEAAIMANHAGADLQIQAHGINLSSLAPYMQGTLQPVLTEGQFKAALHAVLDTNEIQQNIEIGVKDLVLQESGQAMPLIRVDQATARFAISEPNTLILNEISFQGLETLAQTTETGDLQILGLVSRQTRTPVPSDVTTIPLPTGANIPAKPKASQALRLSLTELPTVILKSLNLHIANLTYVDRSHPLAAPIVARDIRLRSTASSRLLSHNLETIEPLHLELSGSLTPLMDSFKVSTTLSPFDPEPTASFDLDVQGIHGAGLTAVYPDLMTWMDGTGLTNGHLRSKLLVVMRLPRPTLLDFDRNQPFEMTLQLTDLGLADQNEPDLLIGLKEMHAELPVINLGKKEIQIKRLEMIEPQCRVQKTAQGLRLMNLLFKLPDANTPTATSQEAARAGLPTDASKQSAEATQLNLTLDQFVASGLDFTFTDETISPPLSIPLKGMDVELRGLSTQPVSKPIFVNAIVSAGQVPLPLREKRVAKQDSDAEASPTHEAIRLFQEVTVTARVMPGPQPSGWIRAGLSGLELRHFSAAARPSGLTIEEGVLDASLDVRLKENGKARVKTRMILSDLKLNEPQDGPMSKQLKLPVPLDTALFVLRSPDGTIRLPLDFTVTDKGVSSSQITAAALGSASTVIAKAIAGSPLRAVSTVTRILGVADNKEMAPPIEMVLSYSGGALALSPANQATLDALVEQVKKDRDSQLTIQHQLGAADLEYAERLVNPSQQESLDLLNQLQQYKQRLLTERAQLLAQTQAAYATSDSTKVLMLTGHLRSKTRQLGQIEKALDTLLDTLRSGANYARRRRTREGALAIAQARLSTLDSQLAQTGISDYGRRVKIPAPSFARSEEFDEGRITVYMVRTKAK